LAPLAACADKVPAPIRFEAPLVVDLTAQRCPDVAADDASEFERPAPPRPAHWPRAGVGDDEIKAHVDALEATIARKNVVGRRVVREARECRATSPSSAPQS
jgi:hypothetical protein